MQRRDDDEANGDGDSVNGCLGQTERRKQRRNERGNGGFAQPAQRERGKGNAQLASGKVRVDVVGDQFGVLGAGTTLFDKDLNLGFAHANERKLGGDEKRIHDEKEQDKKKA